MKKHLILIPIFLLLLLNSNFAQVVSSGSKTQPTTIKPGELAGSNFNGDVNLFTGTYGASYTIGSVATFGGLKYDLNMVYSSSLSAGDNVPVASGIPYGEGWGVQVPTISVSVADYKNYSDQILISDANYYNSTSTVDDSKTFSGEGSLYWFSPIINIPGVASGRAIFKYLDPQYFKPVFVLEAFEGNNIELFLDGNKWEAHLPDGTVYTFLGSVSYRKGLNKRIQDAHYYEPSTILNNSGYNNVVEGNIKPKTELLEWHCTQIRNSNMPGQSIVFRYKGFGHFNFFKELSSDYMYKMNVAFNHTPQSAYSTQPDLEVTTDAFLTEVFSRSPKLLDKIVLEYGSEACGINMLNPVIDESVERLDSLYNYKTVYTTEFVNWKQYMHPKHPDIVSNYIGSSSITPSATNPFVANGAGTGSDFDGRGYIRRDASDDVNSGSSFASVAFNHSFLESPRIGGNNSTGLEDIELVGGDIYEIKTKVWGGGNANQAFGFANIDINIASGKMDSDGHADSGFPAAHLGSGIQIVSAYKKDNFYTNDAIFSTFGNAVKWNPAAAAGGSVVSTSNLFTMPNIPQEYNGITIQVGPGNSDNFFNLNPFDITGLTLTGLRGKQSAHHSYWKENQGTNWGNNAPMKQDYDAVPSNFGVGLPWQMMSPITHRFMDPFGFQYLDVSPNSPLFNFWWKDEVIGIGDIDNTSSTYPYENIPTLLSENVRLSDVELIRYSKNPYMLQSVKTYRTNGNLSSNYPEFEEVILVTQFDLDYEYKDVAVVDNAIYDPTKNPVFIPNRWTSSYLLKNIQNIPVNRTQDISNSLPVINDEVATTHFEYATYSPGIPISSFFNSQNDLRTNTSLFPLNKVINHLGKETEISYYPFDDASHRRITPRYLSSPPISIGGTSQPRTLLQERNFAVQINLTVQSITINGPTVTEVKKWDYDYSGTRIKWGKNLPTISTSPSIFSPSLNLQIGWQTTTVTEPEINGLRPYSKYYHLGESSINTGTTIPNMLFGKLNKVENYNGLGEKISDKEIFYEVTKAFENGLTRPSRWGWYLYDYYDYDFETLVQLDNTASIPTGMLGIGILTGSSTFLETSIPGHTSDSYFIKKVKEIDTEYETTTCNIPVGPIVDNPSFITEPDVPGVNDPAESVTNIQSRIGDDALVGVINAKRFGKSFTQDLIDASPLSDNVLLALLDKKPYYKARTYNLILEEQTTLSDAVFAKLLDLPVAIRKKVLGKAIVNQEYQLSTNQLKTLIATQPPVNPTLIQLALTQYNDLPEDILLSILNRNPKYTPEFIGTVLLKQVQLSEDVHQTLLGKSYLPNNLIKKVFVNGASYPSDNSLLTLITRKPKIEAGTIETILLASPYHHSQQTMDALTANVKSRAIIAAVERHNLALPSWTAYCGNGNDNSEISIQYITEYEYWDANEQGETTSDGFKKLLGVEDESISLLFEPSWQLYKTKSYSPQLPGAFTEKEYFYYYDLKNKYNRREAYVSENPTNYDYVYDYGSNSNVYVSGVVNGAPLGLKLSQKYNLRTIVYQERTSSKNIIDVLPKTRSTFYHYTNVWNENELTADIPTINMDYNDENYCNPTDDGGGDDPFPGGDEGFPKCNKIFYKSGDTAPIGTTVYQTPDGIYACPCSSLSSNIEYIPLASNCDFDGPDDTGKVPPPSNYLEDHLFLKEVNTQIDVLVNDEYFATLADFPFPSNDGLMEFKVIGEEFDQYSGNNIDVYGPSYPFDVLKVKEIVERNQFSQVQLESNEKELLTRYWYTIGEKTKFFNTACDDGYGDFGGFRHYNIGVPVAITVGFGLPDSLRTEYEYYPDYSVKQITDPNGIQLSYTYDEYGRLKESYRNGNLLSTNQYSTWNNDFSKSFLDRSLDNYVQTFQLKDDGDKGALKSRKYIDPLGRDFHTLSTEVPDYTENPIINWKPTEVVHTGQIVYDNWNRAVETYKPFVDGDGINPVYFDYVQSSLTNPTTNSNLYPHISSTAMYENDQKSRVLREAKPGEQINTAHNVKYRYSMANYVCGGCELELSREESDLILGANPAAVKFKVVEVEDEDGKVSKEYFNALGQKVATKQFIGMEEAITLFVYDSYGNLTKVINPEKQESNYNYNMLGWLYQKETVDGGVTKYMFNESGQVVLEQDQNARLEVDCADNTEKPYYREYEYDIFGRLTDQSKKYYEKGGLDISANVHVPMLYTDLLYNVTESTDPNAGIEVFHDGQFYEGNTGAATAYLYKFSNNSTYAWKASTHFFELLSDGTNSYYGFQPNLNYNIVHNWTPFYEKQLSYGEDIALSANNHSTTNTILSSARKNMKGNLSHSTTYGNSYCANSPKLLRYDFYSYTDDGNLAWQIQQYNPNGITSTKKGGVARIDYSKYDLNNNLLVQNVDVNNDLVLDMQYNYSYDYRNRIREVRVSLENEEENGELLASYEYNNATGLVTATNYHKDCEGGSNQVDGITYLYDERDRLTNINSQKFFDYNLYYDNNMPTSNVGTLATIANYNGNINGIMSTYNFAGMQNYVIGSNFDTPSAYAYKYDGINRLTEANAYWDENGLANNSNHVAAKYGDVSYAFDKIGNLTRLTRHIDALGGVEGWSYNYQTGNNKLSQVVGQNATTATRNYTYDATGNLLTDDFRKVNQSIYGRANLPFDIDLDGTKAAQYMYDASDARIFKAVFVYDNSFELGVTDLSLGLAESAEYYLRDAAGNTIGVFDINKGEWTWYVFGRERFAKIKPTKKQQPAFYASDNNDVIDRETNKQFVDEVKKVMETDPTTQTQLLNIQCADSTCFWISEDNLSNFTDTVPEGEYTIVKEFNLTNPNQLVSIDKEQVSIGVLSGLNRSKADSTVVLPDTIIDVLPNALGKKPKEFVFLYTYHSNTVLDNISYYIHDHLGNTRIVFKPVDPVCNIAVPIDFELEYAADYYPYGKVLREFNPEAEKYMSTHHERDVETGLDYRGARYYDSDIARFLSLDPLAHEFAEWSPYNYVVSNPITYIDPDGRGPQQGGGNGRARIPRRGNSGGGGGRVEKIDYKPIIRNLKRDQINYLEPRESVLDPITNIGNTLAPKGRILVESFAEYIETIKTRQEWSKNTKGEEIQSKVGYIINFKTPALQSKYDELQSQYAEKFNAHVQGTYTDEEYSNLPAATKSIREANAEFQLGPSPRTIILTAFKILSDDNNGDLDVTTVTQQKTVIYDANE